MLASGTPEEIAEKITVLDGAAEHDPRYTALAQQLRDRPPPGMAVSQPPAAVADDNQILDLNALQPHEPAPDVSPAEPAAPPAPPAPVDVSHLTPA